MSWSLQIHNGDFTVGGGHLGTVSDANKLTQDLRCALLEPMGTDEMHLDYGSLIDGGTLPDGTVVPSIIGQDVPHAATALQTEIQRVAQYYQAQQLARARNDRLAYNRASLTAREVLLSLSGIEIDQMADHLTAHVGLQTAAGQDVNISLGLSTNGS